VHQRIVSGLSTIPRLWKIDFHINAPLDLGKGESAAANLADSLAFGLGGQLSYSSRYPGAICDKAMSDDFLIIRGDVDLPVLTWLEREVFPQIVAAFLPYRAACVTDLDLDLDDFDDIVSLARQTNFDVDGRDSVYRFWAANYFDDLCCVRAFRIGSLELTEKLTGIFEIAEAFKGGALLVKENGHEDVVALDAYVRNVLDGE